MYSNFLIAWKIKKLFDFDLKNVKMFAGITFSIQIPPLILNKKLKCSLESRLAFVWEVPKGTIGIIPVSTQR